MTLFEFWCFRSVRWRNIFRLNWLCTEGCVDMLYAIKRLVAKWNHPERYGNLFIATVKITGAKVTSKLTLMKNYGAYDVSNSSQLWQDILFECMIHPFYLTFQGNCNLSLTYVFWKVSFYKLLQFLSFLDFASFMLRLITQNICSVIIYLNTFPYCFPCQVLCLLISNLYSRT